MASFHNSALPLVEYLDITIPASRRHQISIILANINPNYLQSDESNSR